MPAPSLPATNLTDCLRPSCTSVPACKSSSDHHALVPDTSRHISYELMNQHSTTVSTRARVYGLRNLSDSTYVVRFDRRAMDFEPGQYVCVGVPDDINMREYSVYSAPQDDFLEILVKEVDGGRVSRRLRQLAPGDELEVGGPFGFFVVDEAVRGTGKLLFVATGTGISPFHSFARAYEELDYRLLHGVRTLGERYEHGDFPSARIVACASRESIAGGIRDSGRTAGEQLLHGRVTDYLRRHPVSSDTFCYLCGNCDMIYESFDILKGHGVPPEQLFAEVYF